MLLQTLARAASAHASVVAVEVGYDALPGAVDGDDDIVELLDCLLTVAQGLLFDNTGLGRGWRCAGGWPCFETTCFSTCFYWQEKTEFSAKKTGFGHVFGLCFSEVLNMYFSAINQKTTSLTVTPSGRGRGTKKQPGRNSATSRCRSSRMAGGSSIHRRCPTSRATKSPQAAALVGGGAGALSRPRPRASESPGGGDSDRAPGSESRGLDRGVA